MQVEDRFYIYLEYVHPGSINKYVREHCGAITESVVRNFTRHILTGLAYLHRMKTIHRYNQYNRWWFNWLKQSQPILRVVKLEWCLSMQNSCSSIQSERSSLGANFLNMHCFCLFLVFTGTSKGLICLLIHVELSSLLTLGWLSTWVFFFFFIVSSCISIFLLHYHFYLNVVIPPLYVK